MERHDLQAAIRSLNEELEHSPQNLKALNLLGIALTAEGQREQANTKFKQALTINPHFYPARKNFAVNEFDMKRLSQAEAEFTKVLEDAPDDEITHLYLGELRFEKQDYPSALKHYERGRGRIGQKPSWVLHCAQSALEVNDPERANQILRILSANDPEDRFQAGLLLGKAGMYAFAADLFGSARRGYHDPYSAGYNQLLMLTKAKRYPQAIAVFNQLVSEGFQRAELYNLASESYLHQGDLQNAVNLLRTATQLEPKSEDNYVDLASVCLEYEEYSLGMEILDVGIHYIPNSYRLYVQRGVVQVMQGSMAEAEKDFQTASDLAPEKSLPYFALGEVWIQGGQTDKAVKVLREKSNLPGMDYLIPYIFGVALIRSGAEPGTSAANEAVAALEESIELNQDFSHSHVELGKLLFKQGDLDRAITELKAASALDPNDAGPVYVLAQAYRKKGDKSEAEAMLARVAALHSEDHNLDVKHELKRLIKQDTAAASEAQTSP